jgi:hypothetical protein
MFGADMILFLITSLSDLMIQYLLLENNNGDVLVVTPRQDVAKLLSEFGINTFFLSTDKYLDVKDRDREFKELAMPGVFSDTVFDGTDLPAWQVLSIDRLKFWYIPENEIFLDFIDSSNLDKVYVSFDIGSALPIPVMLLADKREAHCVAVKTEPIKTIEIFDMIPFLTFNEYLVNEKEDVRFLKNAGVQENITVISKGDLPKTEYPSKETLRETLGITPDITVSGIRFDKRDERQCRKALEIIKTNDNKKIVPFIFPVDDRSAELAPSSLYEYKEMIYIQYQPEMMAACDEIICFRWDDNYCLDLPIDPTIFDIHGINKAEFIAPKHIEIQGIPT